MWAPLSRLCAGERPGRGVPGRGAVAGRGRKKPAPESASGKTCRASRVRPAGARGDYGAGARMASTRSRSVPVLRMP